MPIRPHTDTRVARCRTRSLAVMGRNPWLRPQPRKYKSARRAGRSGNKQHSTVAAPHRPPGGVQRQQAIQHRRRPVRRRGDRRQPRHRQRRPSQPKNIELNLRTNACRREAPPLFRMGSAEYLRTEITAQVRDLPGDYRSKRGQRKPFNRATGPPGVKGRRPGGQHPKEYMKDARRIARRAPAKIGRGKLVDRGGGE